jgi:hypothetical protein
MTARIVARAQLRYAEGPDATLDRPAHVRAGSGLRYVETVAGGRLVVAQDDASFLAVVDPTSMRATSIALPAGPGGKRLFGDDRGNKKDKLDLECVETFTVDERPLVVALGSGSLPPRERAVLARLDRGVASVQVVDASALFAALRAHPLLASCELNLEGMCRVANAAAGGPARVRLFQRGNGAGAVDATIDVEAAAFLAYLHSKGGVPALLDVRVHSLGEVKGVRLTFTDACARGDTIFVTAAAEACPNAVDDGEVVGCAFGTWLAPSAQWQLDPILDEGGKPWVGKPEGLALHPSDPARAWIVVDKDDASQPAELLTLTLDSWTSP